MSKQAIQLSLVDIQLMRKKLVHRIIPNTKWH